MPFYGPLFQVHLGEPMLSQRRDLLEQLYVRYWIFMSHMLFLPLNHACTTGKPSGLVVFNVRQSYSARSWYRLDVCPSVCLFVTGWYCIETAQPIGKLSSLFGSPMILVFWGPNIFPEFQREHQNGGVKCKGVGKSCNFRPISRYSS